MADDLMGYNKLMDNALKQVVRDALTHAANFGLPGDHHFYITFKTHMNGVKLPKSLLEKYPEEITIVIQHQFWDLKVSLDHFSIGLSFNGKQEYLRVPFYALSGFADPSVKFGLQFTVDQQLLEDNGDSVCAVVTPVIPENFTEDEPAKPELSPDPENIVMLDKFRNK